MTDDTAKTVNETYAEWESTTLKKTLERFPERKEQFETPSGQAVERLYWPGSIAATDYVDDLGFPGQFPFTRGVQPTMYRGRFWTMRQYAGFATAAETNQRYRYLLERGQTGLSVAFDLPTQMGYDSDHEMARGEVGRTGVAIDSLEDMETLFDQIPLGTVSTSMTINSTAAILLSMYLALCERQGVDPRKIRGTIQNDILKEYIARGTYIFPPAPSMRVITDLFSYCKDNVPAWNPISISGYHIREAGSTAAQEVAFTLIDGIAYVQAALDAGLEVDAFAGRLSFFFASHNNLLEEVAKFRAARRLWARIMRERFGAKNDSSCALRFHTQTCGHTLTAQQPQNNVVRVAIQALAAVLGGTQSLHTNSFDEAFALPTEKAVTIALRTQQILAHESGVADTPDPLAGSYAIEAMTARIEQDAKAYIDRVDGMGGAVKAIETGYIQREIADAAYRTQMDIEKEKQIIVGLNKYAEVDKQSGEQREILRLDPAMERSQVERLQAVRARRDEAAHAAALASLERAAKGGENLVPRFLTAVKAYATVGEISDVLRTIFGVYKAS
ncbi:MAG: methylmalonyl-CoA mutase family protein [bacterium]